MSGCDANIEKLSANGQALRYGTVRLAYWQHFRQHSKRSDSDRLLWWLNIACFNTRYHLSQPDIFRSRYFLDLAAQRS